MEGQDLTAGDGRETPLTRAVSRRTMLKAMGAGAFALGGSGLVAACGSSSTTSSSTGAAPAIKTGKSTIRIGYVSPQTGALADFSQSDAYVLGKVRDTSAFKKMTIAGKTYTVEIIEVDSQSDANRATQVTQQLINQDKVDMIVTSSAPETTNPVASTAEQLRVPCLATVVPWEAWYAGLGGNPAKPTTDFAYNSMFFFGIEEFGGTFLPMWDRIQKQTGAAKVFGGMFPNDSDGNAFRAGFPPAATAAGYKFVDGGAYTDGSTEYSAMIEKFKSNGCEFFINAPLPPDFNTFWKQAQQSGFKPKLATVAKVLLFPSDVVALGGLVENIATDAWWTPYAPYSSSLSGESAKDFATGFQSSTGSEWVQSMGSCYSLFEVAGEALKSVDDPHDRAQLAAAVHKVNYKGISGPINFGAGPAPGVGIIKPVGVQWKKGKSVLGKTFPYEAFVVDNSLNHDVPLTGDLEATNT